MYGKILREWFLFLKKRKLFSRFIIHHRAANISCRTWGREKLSIKLSNGADHIFPIKDDSLNFEYFLSNIHTMDWFLPYGTEGWYNLAVKFGELKGYIKKRESSSSTWTLCYDDENPFTYNGRNRLKSDKKQKEEGYGKWYDRFIGANAKNRYRR